MSRTASAQAGPIPPSTSDLGLFFEPHHTELARRLEGAPAPPAAGDPRAILRQLGRELGVLAYLAPAEPGGRLDVRALCLARERLASASPLADALFAVQGLAAHALLGGCRDPARADLDRALAGDEILAFALTEPEAGSDAAALAARATPEGGGYRLRGEKTLISNAPIADRAVVFATADPDAGARGIAAFDVPARAAGVSVSPAEVVVEHPIGDVSLADAWVPASAVVAAPGEGFSLAMRALEQYRVTVGAAAVGMARRALAEAIAHTGDRRQFGAPLSDNPVIRSELAEMATEVDAARLLVFRAARDLDLGAGSGKASAMAKLYATEAAQRIIDRAVQLHGGAGVTRGSALELLYRAIRPLRIYEGTSEILRLVVARDLLGETRSAGKGEK